MRDQRSTAGGRFGGWSDWFDTVLVAIGTGLLASLLLGLAALFLAWDAAAQEPPPRDTPRLVLKPRADGAPVNAPLLHTSVELYVTGPIVRAKVVHTFENPYADWKEGVYLFPLPEGAAVDRLKMRVGERTIEGEIKERGEAKRNYERAKDVGQRAALVEQERPNLFTASVANIGPHERIAVEIVIDTSGSMEGASIVQARQALQLALERLEPSDRFNVIEFNSHAKGLFPSAQSANERNLADAKRWVGALRAQGGTEMGKALDLALDGRDDPGVVRQIMFLTDGAVANEDELFRMISGRLGGSRLFTVGIGSAPNSHFMTKAAALGGGTFTFIGRIEEVGAKMSALFGKLESPMLKNVRIEWPAGVVPEAWPRRIPDLYAGEPIIVSAAGARLTGEVKVSGLLGDRPWQQHLSLDGAKSEGGIGKLWARRKIEDLVDSQRGTPDPASKDAAVTVALEHSLVSKFTALVALDKTPVRPADQDLKQAAVAANLPEGWVHDAVFGEMPQTATPAQWHALIGMIALAFALLCLMPLRRRVAA